MLHKLWNLESSFQNTDSTRTDVFWVVFQLQKQCDLCRRCWMPTVFCEKQM